MENSIVGYEVKCGRVITFFKGARKALEEYIKCIKGSDEVVTIRTIYREDSMIIQKNRKD